MGHIKISLLAILGFGLTSCDYSMHVAVRNYKEPCRVNVTYQKTANTLSDNDSLLVKFIDNPKFDNSLDLINTSSNSYYFTAPSNKEVVLKPVSLGQPIKQIEIINSPDSAWKIDLGDRKQFKKLKKSGQIKTKGFIFTTSIFIENK